ncbi:MAG: SIS domain-containing protein [Alphaproteobacteria bacterium]
MTASAPRPQTAAFDAVAVGRDVLVTESAALASLAQSLGEPFAEAVERLYQIPGRVAVTGMGKSGHVARKIAATLASTGTPALFVHPGEASHGDLGMVGAGDAVLALSNSGETPELNDIIAYTRRFSIPLIALTATTGSSLGQAADVRLILPPAPEAGVLALAPTTSTTMMLALGDALAVALLERRGFTADDFRVFHPGGQLGRRLLRVRDVMHRGPELPLIGLDPPMSEALIALASKRFGCIGVIDDDGRLAGMITDGDLRRHLGPDLLNRPVSEVMTRQPLTTTPEVLAAEVLAALNARQIIAMFVVEADRPVGLIHVHDILAAGVA